MKKQCIYFPEIVLKARKDYEPHFLVLYLTELAGIFNGYYAKNKIADKTDEFSPYKVALTKAFTTVMKNGMWMLGIKRFRKNVTMKLNNKYYIMRHGQAHFKCKGIFVRAGRKNL